MTKVKRLLRELGDTNDDLALGDRFRKTSSRLEATRLEKPQADIYAKLTLAVHDLNFLLSNSFYPG
jgi:hypothetical protein